MGIELEKETEPMMAYPPLFLTYSNAKTSFFFCGRNLRETKVIKKLLKEREEVEKKK